MITTPLATHLNELREQTYVLIPAFNEMQVLRDIIKDIFKAGYSNIIIVDDGSTEDLFTLIHDLEVIYVRHKKNLGQGAAIQTGFEFARKLNAGFIVTFDADGQHDPQNLDILLNEISTSNVDVVLGSRFLRKNNLPFVKYIVLQVARLINYFFTGLLLSDAHNGLRILNKKALHSISLTENRMAHATEFLFELKKHHLKWKEVPVIIHYTKYSMSKGQRISNGLKILIDLFLYKSYK